MTRAPRAWVLNLDADLELENPRHTPSRSLERTMSAAKDRLATMLPAGDVVLDSAPDERARGLVGRCFCPTPSALRRLERAGALVPDAPPPDVLARVNERGFAFALHHLEGAARCTDERSVERALARPGRWLLKRAFGFAGRGQRKVDAGNVTESDRAWIRASLRRGALYVEPRVEIELEIALHGELEQGGSCERGVPTVQLTQSGAWVSSRRAEPEELADDERLKLDRTFARVVDALREAGYFGPFGIDAFRYRDERGTHLQPLSDLNARYTMAWGTGMGRW